MMRKTRKLVSTMLNSCQVKVILEYFPLFLFLEGWGFGLGVAVCFVKSEEICSSQINVSKERKGAKYCNTRCQ